MEHDALADVVVLTVKSTMAPILERLASTEARLSVATALEKTYADLRDRIVVVETKAAVPVVQPEPSPVVDLAPVLERVSAIEARQSAMMATEKTLGELRDRLVVIETKAAIPVPPDAAFYELRDHVIAIENKAAQTPAVPADLLARVTALEMRPVAVPAEKAVDLAPMSERVTKLELLLETKAAELVLAQATIADLAKDISAMRERLAVAEVRQPVPGPSGPAGRDGKDGADGLGFDDLTTAQQDDRSFTIKAVRGDRVKEIGTARFPGIPIQRGVYVEGKSYAQGDIVTWAGSQWYANEDTVTKPGDGSKAWVLIVKRGRDGRDGKDAETLPVVSVGRPQ